MTKSGESTIINHNRQIMSRNLYPKRNSYIKERGTIIMTKIKNTKKGMAKKTLSMSLVVAMLATSNVPVWAAEFSDGTDVAVTSEAPAADVETFSDDTDSTPERTILSIGTPTRSQIRNSPGEHTSNVGTTSIMGPVRKGFAFIA